MLPPIPLRVDLYWHPAARDRCRPIAEAVYKMLNRDPSDSARPGLGIPVRFYETAEPPPEPERPERLLRLILSTPELALAHSWKDALARIAADDVAAPETQVTVKVGLDPGLADGGRLDIDLSGETDTKRAAVDIALLQCCRLLSGRVRTGERAPGAAPLKLFISHTKRDPEGRKAGLAIQEALQTARADSFFDEYQLQPGDFLSPALANNIDDSALLVIWTDRYRSSPWCRMELDLARKEQRPIVVIDALSETGSHTSSLFANLPIMRLDTRPITASSLRRVVSFIGLEALRFLYIDQILRRLKASGILPPETKLRVRPPDPQDLRGEGRDKLVFAHSDPVLSQEEAAYIQEGNLTLVTPTGVWGNMLAGQTVGLSVGTAEEEPLLQVGLSALHLTDSTRVIARSILAAGGNLLYGGSLELSGPPNQGENLVSALFEMIGTYNRSGTVEFPPLRNVAAWPFWYGHSLAWLAQHQDMLQVERLDPPKGAEDIADLSVAEVKATARGCALVAISLSGMRRHIAENTQARVFLGGATYGYSGLMPGILEEALLAIDRDCPVYIFGGFGGAAAALVDALDGSIPDAFTLEVQLARTKGYREMLAALNACPDAPVVDYPAMLRRLRATGIAGIARHNGLSVEENRHLWSTRDLDTAVALVMQGLRERLRSGEASC